MAAKNSCLTVFRVTLIRVKTVVYSQEYGHGKGWKYAKGSWKCRIERQQYNNYNNYQRSETASVDEHPRQIPFQFLWDFMDSVHFMQIDYLGFDDSWICIILWCFPDHSFVIFVVHLVIPLLRRVTWKLLQYQRKLWLNPNNVKRAHHVVWEVSRFASRPAFFEVCFTDEMKMYSMTKFDRELYYYRIRQALYRVSRAKKILQTFVKIKKA